MVIRMIQRVILKDGSATPFKNSLFSKIHHTAWSIDF
jgi:hypothetical protein